MIADLRSGLFTRPSRKRASIVSASGSPSPAIHAALDGVSLAAIAAQAGTPCYVYSAASIRDAYRTLDVSFGDYPHQIHYALKANSTLALVRVLRALGARADANSMGEVDVALRAGFMPGDIVLTGVGKTPAELDRAAGLGLQAINVESPGELERLDRAARDRGTVVRVALRVNPDIDAQSHPHISPGLRANKFGVPIDEAPALFRTIAARPGLTPVGVHVHIGSQITALDPLVRAAEAAVALATALRAEGITVDHVDVGGGLGISYDGAPVPSPAEYVEALVGVAGRSGFTIAIEPGRVIVGPAGLLLAQVVDVKHFPGSRRFVVLDAGMTELMRPALYGAYHRIEAVAPRPGAPVPVDVVGPVCESTDTFARDRVLPPFEVGDLVAIRDAGAYGAVMASTYLRRPLAPEVLVDGGTARIIRRRQALDDMLALEE